MVISRAVRQTPTTARRTTVLDCSQGSLSHKELCDMDLVLNDIRRWKLWFPFFQVLIAAVSLYDCWLTLRFREVMLETEQNPVGLWLIKVAAGEVWLFLQFKAAGTLVVLLLLFWMFLRNLKFTFTVSGSIASGQTALLVYLTTA
ncbi:MAG: hypothetical protein ACKO3T_11385 [Planctomycetaceae bacterium]|jgi:hypothetical protein